MANITPSSSISIDEAIQDVLRYKMSPSGIIKVSLDRLEDIYQGRIDVTEPSNPFTYLLETSAINTASAVAAYYDLHKKLYPRLANTYDELYRHMSDYDYLGIFSEPSIAPVSFTISYASFIKNAYYDSLRNSYTLTIPRYTRLEVGGAVYTLLYPIIIRDNANRLLDVRYDVSVQNPVYRIREGFIHHRIIRKNNEEKYIQFTAYIPEVSVEYFDVAVEKSRSFRGEFSLENRKYYFTQAYMLNNDIRTDLIVTHTESVYDIHTPTVALKLDPDNNKLKYHIPATYILDNTVSGRVRFLVYTTLGKVDIDYREYNIDDFGLTYRAMDEVQDVTSSGFFLTDKIVFIADRVTGGKDALSFDEIKEAVIDNSIGDRKIPITDKQLEFLFTQKNFSNIKAVDHITNRLYELEASLPAPRTRYPITRINMDINTFVVKIEELVRRSIVIKHNDTTYSLPLGTIIDLGRDQGADFLDPSEVRALTNLSGQSLAYHLNNSMYAATMYHYVIRLVSDTIKLYCYHLTEPKINALTFRNYNPTTYNTANSQGLNIAYTTQGYTIDLTYSYKSLNNITSTVTPILMYKEENGNAFFLLPETIFSLGDNMIARFYLRTAYDLYKDEDNVSVIRFEGFTDRYNNTIAIDIGIEDKLSIVYLTDYLGPDYRPIDTDEYLKGSSIGYRRYVVTEEEMDLRFGIELDMIKRNIRLTNGDLLPRTYDQDVYLTYDNYIVDDDGNVLHRPGEVVKEIIDGEERPVILHKQGDPIVDYCENSVIDLTSLETYIDLSVMDYKSYISDEPRVVAYRKELINYIVTTCNTNAQKVYDELLENTYCYFTYPKSIGYVRVRDENGMIYNIRSDQVFTINVYTDSRIALDEYSKDNIKHDIIKTLDTYLSYENRDIISKTEITDILYDVLKDSVVSISFKKFTELDKDILIVEDHTNGLSIRKSLVVNEAGLLTTAEDVAINFKEVIK